MSEECALFLFCLLACTPGFAFAIVFTIATWAISKNPRYAGKSIKRIEREHERNLPEWFKLGMTPEEYYRDRKRKRPKWFKRIWKDWEE